MADVNLGNLSFDVKLKDLTDADIKKIQKKIEKLGGNVPIDLKVNKGTLVQSVKDALKNENITINVKAKLDANTIKNLTDALNRGLNLNPNAIRNYNAQIQDLTRSMRDLNTQMQGVVGASQGIGQAQKKMQEFKNSTTTANQAVESMKKFLSGFGASFEVHQILQDIIQIGGELQKQKLALGSILQDTGLAQEQFSRIQQLAVKSPYGLMELSQYSKQLAAYSVPYHELYDTMKRIADISAGVGIDMSRIILAFGQVKAANILKGTELRQFTEANIPMLDKLAERFTKLRGELVTTGDVIDMISKKQVSFEDVKAVLFELTDAGGMFYNMQEVLAESLSAKWKNLSDAIANAMGGMADSFIGDGLKRVAEILTLLVQDWQRLTRVVTTASLAYAMFNVRNVTFLTAIGRGVRGVTTLGSTFKTLTLYIKNAAGALLSMAKSFAPLLIITGVIEGIAWAWGKLTENTKRNEEVIENLKGTYEGLSNQLKRFEGINVFKLQEQQLHGVAEELQEIAQNYLPNAGQVINRIFGDTAIESFAQKVELLKQELIAFKEAEESILNAGQSIGVQADKGNLYDNKFSIDIQDAGNAHVKLMEKFATFSERHYKEINKIFKDTEGSTLSEKMYNYYKSHLNEDFYARLEEGGLARYTSQGEESNIRKIRRAIKKYEEDLLELETEFLDWAKRVSKEFNPEDLESLKKALKSGQQLTPEQSTLSGLLSSAIKDVMKSENIKALPNNIQELVYEMFAQEFGVDLRIKVDPKLTERGLTSIQKQLDDATGNQFTDIIKKSGTLLEIYKDIEEQWKKNKEEADAYAKLLERNGINPDDVDSYKGNDPIIKGYIEQYNKKMAIVLAAERGSKEFGYQLGEEQKDTDDPVYDMWKKRYDLIKKAYDEYKKWVEIEGEDRAKQRLQNASVYADLFNGSYGFKIDLDDFETTAQEVLKNLGGTEKQKELKYNITLDISNDKRKKAQEELRKRIEEIKKYIQEQSKNFNLYETLLSNTGNVEFAKKAFNIPLLPTNFTDALTEKLKSALENTGIDMPDFSIDAEKAKEIFGKDMQDLYEIWLAIKNAMEQEGIKLLVDTSEAYKEFMSTEERIKALEDERDAIVKNYEEGSKERLAIEKKYNALILKEREKTYNNTDIWKKLYGGIENAGFFKGRDMLKEVANSVWSATQEGENYKIEYKDAEGNLKSLIVDAETLKDLLEQINKLQEQYGGIKDESGNGDNGQKGGSVAAFLSEGFTKSFGGIGADISAVANAAAAVSDSFANMFEALGDSATADALGMAGSVFKTIGDLASGKPEQMLAAIPNLIASIAQFHDKKLDRAIGTSERKVKKLQSAYKDLERTIERQLGGYMKGQAETQLNNLKEQSKEIEKQIQLEEDKKKTDHSKIIDLEDQLAEMKDQIKYFYEDLASEQYEVNIKDWSKSISDALVEAFAEGTDAATAFDNAVSDILKNLASQMITLQLIEPAFEDLKKVMFNDVDGIATENSLGGIHIVPEEIGILADTLKGIGSVAELVNEHLSAIDKASGGLLTKSGKSSSLSASIQNITESTADLLGSYLNAVRADVSINRTYMQRIAEVDMPRISMTAEAQLRQLEQIVMNTQTIKEHTRGMLDILSQATKFADRGFYMR